MSLILRVISLHFTPLPNAYGRCNHQVIEVDSFELHREPESLEQSFKRASRLGIFIVEPMDDTVGGKAFDDEEWEGEEGDGTLRRFVHPPMLILRNSIDSVRPRLYSIYLWNRQRPQGKLLCVCAH